MLPAVARGDDYRQAALAAGRRSGVAVSQFVARFNDEGLAALDLRRGGGQPRLYDHEAVEWILREARRTPNPATDGTAAWSPATLQKARRSAPDGLPKVSTYTIRRVLREANTSHQSGRTWCPTGTVVRVRKSGPVLVTDPDTSSKKS